MGFMQTPTPANIDECQPLVLNENVESGILQLNLGSSMPFSTQVEVIVEIALTMKYHGRERPS
jgi:hypothetical protein